MNKIVLKTTIFLIRNALNALSYISKEKAGEAGGKIFGQPRKGKITNENNIFLNTAEKETLYYEKIPIQTYLWRGDAEKKILLVHGWESNSARWKQLISLLKKENFTIISLDAPAHGASGSKYFTQPLYMEMINVVLEKYAPKYVVGHSAGAFAVAYAVWKYEPTCVEKIVLLSPLSDNRLVFDMFFNYINTNERVRDGFYAFYTKTYGDLSKLIVREFAKKIFMKALIIHDKNDEIIPESQSLEIHQSWKNSELMLTENLGHSLRHDSVYKKILEFLK